MKEDKTISAFGRSQKSRLLEGITRLRTMTAQKYTLTGSFKSMTEVGWTIDVAVDRDGNVYMPSDTFDAILKFKPIVD